jgi:hypothetical protein
MDPWLAAIVVGAILVFVIGFGLYLGKRWSRPRRLLPYTPQRPAVIPPRPTMAPRPVRQLPPASEPSSTFLTATEQEISDMVDRFSRVGVRNEPEVADRHSQQTLRRAKQVLSGDHWLLALALNTRAVYLIDRGFYAEARGLLEPAVQIISEWPGEGSRDRNITAVKSNLRICQNHLGF